MQTNQIIRKGFAVGIILLFLGATLSQGIIVNTHQISTANKNNNSNSLEEKSKVSCQYFSLRGVEKIEGEISLQDSDRLSKLMDGSDVDAIACELTSLGLVPSSISSEQLRNLISGEYGKKKFTKYSDKLSHLISGGSEVKQNLFCAINGEANSYISRNLRTQLVATVVISPAIALLLIDQILSGHWWYPMWGGFLGILGVLGLIIALVGSIIIGFMDYIPVKLSMIQFVQMSQSYHSQTLAHLNTSGVIGKWELYGKQINLFMMGFFGIWVSFFNPNAEVNKFIGSSLYIKAESTN